VLIKSNIKMNIHTQHKRLYMIKLLEHFPSIVELAMDTEFNCYSLDLKRTLEKFKTTQKNSDWYVDVGGQKVFQSYLVPLLA